MSKINELKYERKFNLGSYEMETILAGASVEDGENPSDVLMSLMEFVNSKGGVSFQKDPAPAPTEKKAKKSMAQIQEEISSKKKEVKEIPSEKGEITVEAVEAVEEKEEAIIEEETVVVAPEKVEVKAAPKTVKVSAPKAEAKVAVPKEAVVAATPQEEKVEPKVKVKAAPTKYDRETMLHKKLVSEMLDTNVKGWKAKAAAAKDASIKLDGEDFLDAEGKILKSFVDKFIAEMK